MGTFARPGRLSTNPARHGYFLSTRCAEVLLPVRARTRCCGGGGGGGAAAEEQDVVGWRRAQEGEEAWRVVGARVFISDGWQVHALRAESGEALFGWGGAVSRNG
eukprot:COSAG01_NODE_2253_length_8073_cov_14.930524_8_plen_105_part_00